jgi:hypothetical protein
LNFTSQGKTINLTPRWMVKKDDMARLEPDNKMS